MSVCVALVIQHVMVKRHIVICEQSIPTLFFHLSNKKKYFRKKYLFFISSKTLSEKFLILRRIEWDMIKNVHWSLRKKQLLLLCDFNKTNFFEFFLGKKTQISNFIKIRPSVVQLFQSDRRTDKLDQTNSCFSQLYERS